LPGDRSDAKAARKECREERMTSYSDEDKYRCAIREVKMRRHVYMSRVEQGRMTQEQADREIALMEAIAEDYQPKRLFDDQEGSK
jgi:hypothetical protein